MTPRRLAGHQADPIFERDRVTEEAVIGRIYADIRAFRIYDGPSEAHRASIARRAVARIKRA